MDGPAATSHDLTPSPALPLLSYWSGFFAGPLVAAIVYLVEPPGTLARSHGKAAAVLWTAVLAVWAPLVVGVVLLEADSAVLGASLPILILVAVAGCLNGTLQIRRGRTALGRPLVPEVPRSFA